MNNFGRSLTLGNPLERIDPNFRQTIPSGPIGVQPGNGYAFHGHRCGRYPVLFYESLIVGRIKIRNRTGYDHIVVLEKHTQSDKVRLNLNYTSFGNILSRASGVGSPTNHPGSGQRQDTGPGILQKNQGVE